MSKRYIIEIQVLGSAITAAIILMAPVILSSRAFAISPDNITETGSFNPDFVQGPDLQANEGLNGDLLESASLTATFVFAAVTNHTTVTLSAEAEITQGCVNQGQNEPRGLQREETETVSISETDEYTINEDRNFAFEVTTNKITGPAEEFTCPSATMTPIIASVLFKDIILKIEGFGNVGPDTNPTLYYIYTTTATFPDQVINSINNNIPNQDAATTIPGENQSGGVGPAQTTTPSSQDTLPPTLTVPNDMILQTNGPTALLVYSVTAQDDRDGTATLDEDNQLIQGDNVGGDIRISCTPSSQYFLPVDSRLVQCFAADAVNNTAQASFIVTVRNTNTSPTGPTDTIAPSLSVPVTRVIPTTSPTGQERVLYDVSATDNIDGTARLDANNILIQEDNFAGSVAISCNPSSNTNFPLGNHTVQCRAIDAAGNRGTASFIVAVTSATANIPPGGGTGSGSSGGITASLSADPDRDNAPCPTPFNIHFTGTITDNVGNRDVHYRIILNDDVVWEEEKVIHFNQPGSQSVETNLASDVLTADKPFQGWMVIEILQPVQLQSNKAEFQITCTPPSTGGAAQAQTLQAENTTTATDDEDIPAITDEGEGGDGGGDDGTDSGPPPPATTDEGEGEAGEGETVEEEAVGGAEVAE